MTLNKLPFTKSTPKIQRVNGATQYFRDHSIYRLEVLNNFVTTDGEIPKVFIEATTKDGNPDSRQLQAPGILPHKLLITIGSNNINDQFRDEELAEIPVTIVTKIKNRDHFYQFWRRRFREAKFHFTLELLPKYPASYRLVELDAQDSFDTSKVLTQKGEITGVWGCGQSGCNQWWTICNTKVPVGAKPIGISAYYDSFNGWGGFEKDKSYFTKTGMCTIYYQHSHNVLRNVSIDVDYYAPATVIVDNQTKLTPISFDQDDAGEARRRAPECSSVTLMPPSGLKATVPGTQMTVVSPQVSSLTGQPTQASSISNFWDGFVTPKVTDGTVPSASYFTVIGDNVQEQVRSVQNQLLRASCEPPSSGTPVLIRNSMGRLKFGRTYEARFNRTAQSYRLLVRLFTGEEEVVSPGHPAPLVNVTDELKVDAKTIVVDIKTPW